MCMELINFNSKSMEQWVPEGHSNNEDFGKYWPKYGLWNKTD